MSSPTTRTTKPMKAEGKALRRAGLKAIYLTALEPWSILQTCERRNSYMDGPGVK